MKLSLIALTLLFSITASAELLRIKKGDIQDIGAPALSACSDKDPTETRPEYSIQLITATIPVQLVSGRTITLKPSRTGFEYTGNTRAAHCEDATKNVMTAVSNIVFSLRAINEGDILVDSSTYPKTCYRNVYDVYLDRSLDAVTWKKNKVMVTCP